MADIKLGYRVRLRSGGPLMTVHSINVSNGGVPKLPRASAWVSSHGVEGDRQRNLMVHGGPRRAVALYSLDLIQQLQAEKSQNADLAMRAMQAVEELQAKFAEMQRPKGK